tara:strand:- start:1083 stop:1253 length:171 start_codon:yes stop_codon:yes gene_type:complete
MTYTDCQNLPLQYRTWFIDRVIKEIEMQKSAFSADSVDEPIKDIGSSITSRARRFK